MKDLIKTLRQGADISRERGLNLDYALIADRAAAAIESLLQDAERYRVVIGMPITTLLRLYNTRFDLREQFIDAIMKENAK